MSEQLSHKRTFLITGFAFFTMFLITTLTQISLTYFFKTYMLSIYESRWYSWIIVAISYYLIGFPLFCFIIRLLPDCEKGESEKFSIKNAVKLLIISYFIVYLTNLIGLGINAMIGLLTKSHINNPLQTVVFRSYLPATILFGGILSPIIEELTFRYYALNKLRKFGDKTAILVTAIAFGCFHGNLSQFFYAVALGILYAYITLKTNSIKTSVALHIMLNTFNLGILTPIASTGSNFTQLILGFLVLFLVILGFVLFLQYRKQIRLDTGLKESENISIKYIYFNPGMLLFYILTLTLMVMVIVKSI